MPASMLAWAAPAAIGALGLAQNSKQQHAANVAQKNQQKLIDYQQMPERLKLAAYQANKAKGLYDPTQRVNDAVSGIQRDSALNLSNIGGALGAQGVGGNDTYGKDILAKASSDALQRTMAAREMIPYQVSQEEQSALGGANPSAYNPGIAAYGDQMNYDRSQVQNPAGFFSSLMPFLQRNKTQAPTGVPSAGVSAYDPNYAHSVASNFQTNAFDTTNAGPKKIDWTQIAKGF